MKTFIEWSEKYSVNNEIIDSQHKQLIALINKLYNSFMELNEHEVQQKVINDLKDYTLYHFKTEEDFFAKVNYDHSADHIEQHKGFVNEIKKFADDHQKNPSILSIKMLTYLQKWLFEHILGSDQKYKSWLDNNL